MDQTGRFVGVSQALFRGPMIYKMNEGWGSWDAFTSSPTMVDVISRTIAL